MERLHFSLSPVLRIGSLDWIPGVQNRAVVYILGLLTFTCISTPSAPCPAGTFTLKNGMQVSGKFVKLSSIGSDVFGGGTGAGVKSIYMVDDDLRRTYFSTYQKPAHREEVEKLESIRLRQNIARAGPIIGAIGPYFRSPTPFNDFGRRTVYLMTAKGRVEVVQGITEVTPVFTKAEGLQTDRPYIWDTRLATSSIPRATLTRILRKHLCDDVLDDRLKIVRLYLQSERYGDAEEELRSAIDDFPKLKDLTNQLVLLHQLHAAQQLEEIKIRKAAGQHALAGNLLQNFPERDVAGELLVEVRELVDEYSKKQSDADRTLELFDAQLDEQPDGARKETLLKFREELINDLGSDTIDRMVSYLRLSDDEEMTSEQKLSLAVSRWLLGTDGTNNMAVAMSLLQTRDLVRRYLVSEDASERQSLLLKMRSQEAASPNYVAKLLAAMRPVLEVGVPQAGNNPTEESMQNEPADKESEQAEAVSEKSESADDKRQPKTVPGLYEFDVPGLREGQSRRYVVQLPPEYHAYRRYPAIVTLHGARSSPQRQLEWWVGNYNEQLQMRTGQAARHGYIVIAPAWTTSAAQRKYKYSAAEHAAVLTALRDAMRRFSIDTDRVFLTGHSLGGDAAWDIGLAHPDLWAGVIPIAATAVYADKSAPKYVNMYAENARHVPTYFVAGALDVARISANARDFNRYLKFDGYDSMVVEYRGRGHEHFQDEVHRIFQWMELHKRDFYPKELEAHSLRPWDNFFWWVEFDGLPKGSIVLPPEWPKPARPLKISASVRSKQTLTVRCGAKRTTLWLSPELVNLDQRITVNVGGRKQHEVNPSVEVMLEDVRLRADRDHPFWAKIVIDRSRR